MFSLDLPDDVIQVRDWVHQFAQDVMRPQGHEWDEREEFPWPIVEQAAKIIGVTAFPPAKDTPVVAAPKAYSTGEVTFVVIP